MCFGCSKELSHVDSSFEYPQHMFWLRSKKNNFQLHTLIMGPGRHIVLDIDPVDTGISIGFGVAFCLHFNL